ncbi:MAG: U32 family peptidase [Verrucomicrobia bacterium]|nr:U32 family peptidase [Verrucomicrobiota bacterium]
MPTTETASSANPAAPQPRLRRPEVLAPAGDWDCVRAAVENGADAVYFGLERFNARMRAHNFTLADLPALMSFLHRRGVRGYVTFNTLVFADELDGAAEYLRPIIAAGVDAAIVQDIGIFRLIRQLSPDFPIHGSTQMTITSAAGVAFARQLGAELVVLARENNLADIAKIQESSAQAGTSLPLEVFVHGALCVAYSGQCLTSESLGGRSANRGECAQACRLPYDLVSDGRKVDLGDRRYLLSPRDLSGIDVLPDLIRNGIASLKIEGRLKSAEYVASITRIYRQAVDRAMGAFANEAKPAAALPAADRYELEMSFSRGLSTGWFGGTNNRELVHARFGTKRGVFLGEISRVQNETVSLRLVAPLKPGDGVVFDAGRPEDREEGGRIYTVEQHGQEVTLGFGHGDINFARVKPGQLLWKTNDPALDRGVRQTFAGEKIRYQRPITLEVHGHTGAPLTLIANDGEGHVVRLSSQINLEPATNHPLTPSRLEEQLGRLGGTPFNLGSLTCALEGDVMLPVSELNRLRREIATELERLRALPKLWTLNPSPVGACLQAINPTDRLQAGSYNTNQPPELILVVRSMPQLEAALRCAGADTIYCEFENPKHYREAVLAFREDNAQRNPAEAARRTIWVLPPRIFKPGEEWILKQVRSSDADGYLVRNYDHLSFFAGDRKRGDFSLNVANPLTAEYFIKHCGLERVTASYDLNVVQLEALLASAPALWFDLTLHQHMPMFHMEHCVFCAFLSEGKDYHDCGRPCDSHEVKIRDRVGAELPLKADAGCRNTVFNNRAQTGAEYLDRFLARGARSFRVEFVDESPDEVLRIAKCYHQLLLGEIRGADLWREFKFINQLGVTRGQLEAASQVIHRKI